jgi:hypothetical protein
LFPYNLVHYVILKIALPQGLAVANEAVVKVRQLLDFRLARGTTLQMLRNALFAGFLQESFDVCDQEFFAFCAVHFSTS